MMSKRSKRLLHLALGDQKVFPKNAAQSKEWDYDVYEIKELEEDPWIEFKKWKTKNNKDNREDVELKEHGPDYFEDQNEPTEYVASSVSWIPSESENASSNGSKEVPLMKPLKYKESWISSESKEVCSNESKDAAIPYIESLKHKEPLDKEGLSKTLDNEIIPTNEVKKIKILQDITIKQANEKVENITVPKERHLIIQIKRMDEMVKNKKELKQEDSTTQLVGAIGDSKKVVEFSYRKTRIWDKKDRCVFCGKDCTNFSRHLYRNHNKEDSVQKILELPKGAKERKQMIDLLRKEGNIKMLEENKIRPVQRGTQKYANDEVQEFMPCPYCKGIYRLKTLRKHSKKCPYNSSNEEKCNIASLGQNVLVFKESRKLFLNKLRLAKEVFPKMRADRAAFSGKNDPVICQYAEDYLRKHRRPHIKNAVSNKVRELGRLLIVLQDLYGINTILEALNTKHYDKVVHAAQVISGYDVTLKQFTAPSLAMHLKTILLATCLAAKTLLLKEDSVLPVTNYTEMLKTVKNFRLLVDERWKFDMSSLALKDLNEKHGKKLQKLPITSDVIKFREYTVSIAEQSMTILVENFNDFSAFKKLTEASLVLTILLNRKRVGDVQYVKVDSYTQNAKSKDQEECLNALTDTEKLLSAHFKRIITVGKGSKSIPILFPENVQTYINTLLTAREHNQLIPKENPFLFALTGSKDKWIDGSAALRKFAANCGAENPKTLTSSRLRKQIGTVLQLLNLNEMEKEQVASFMGHTKKTHEEYYRLPQDVYQTAKIAKLLLMMDKGEGAEFQGKTLEEIDVNLEELSKESPVQIDSDTESINEINICTNELFENKNEENGSTQSSEETINAKKKKLLNTSNTISQRGSWNEQQKCMMKKYFSNHIKSKITPKKHECLHFQNKHIGVFEDKTWVQIKTFVYNTFRKQK